jgi:ADP-heptose:LPS heptosyltransferase
VAVTTATLALRAAGLGDLLVAVPAIRALARAPGLAPLTVAAPRWLHDVVHLVPGVAAAHDADGGSVAAPRPAAASIELAVNLHGRGPQSHRALMALRPRHLLAYRSPGVWQDGPVWPHGLHERHRWCHLLDTAGILCDPDEVAIDLPSVGSPVPGAVVVHLGGKDDTRRLTVRQGVAVARACSAAGAVVVVTGAAPDRARAEAVLRGAGLPAGGLLAGSTTLAALAALVAEAALVVSGDTGAAHLASSYATPSVICFGTASPAHWGPPERAVHRVLHDPRGVAHIRTAALLDAVTAASDGRVLA